MILKRSSLLGLVLSTTFAAYACGSDGTTPGYGGTGSPSVPTGTGGTTGGTVGVPPAGGTTAGTTIPPATTAGGTGTSTGVAGGGTTAGTRPGGTIAGGATMGGSIAGATTAGTSPTGGAMAGVDAGAGDAGTGEGGAPPVASGGKCSGLPAITDFAAKGPFDSKMFSNTGPDGTYVLYRPDTTLGKDGLKHPIITWGNGIATSADQYQTLLGFFASHGFVIIACPSDMPERPCLNNGMDWLVKQNTAEGPMKGKLDTDKEITMGYSWGGGAEIDTANRPNVKASISFHGMPPRESDPWTKMHAPLLLFTSTGDTFVSSDGYVLPNYNNSKVSTFYAQLQENVGHVYPCDTGSLCDSVGGIAFGGPATGAIKEQAPGLAWLRYWVCGDESAKKYFFGGDCILCKAPWKSMNKPAGAFK